MALAIRKGLEGRGPSSPFPLKPGPAVHKGRVCAFAAPGAGKAGERFKAPKCMNYA